MRSIVSLTLPRALVVSALAIGTGVSQEAPAPAPQTPPPTSAPQQPGPSQPGQGVPGGSQQPGRPGTSDRFPTPGRDPQSQMPDLERQRMFFFSGKVMLDDGTPPPEQVVIERVCNGVPRPEAYTDSKGRFSFQLGQNQGMFMDASVSAADPGFGGGGGTGNRMPGMGGRPAITERDLMGCELRASLAGFQSTVVALAGRRALDNPDVGTLILRRLAKVDGFTFSATTAYAPKDARKALEKGQQAVKKKKWADAEKELTKATTEYPQFAAAWYELGSAYHQQSKIEDARRAYGEAIKSDAKFITPYAQLARIAAAEKKWDETAEHAGKVIKLNPYFSPEPYFLSGVANLNLNKLDTAEEHAREALKMDANHRNPKIAHLLGFVLAQKQDYAGAAENMRNYLKFAPNAGDADQVRQMISEIEKRMSGAQPAAQQQQQ